MKTDSKQMVAGLQSRVDHLETELNYLNDLLIRCGFDEGIKTLKMSAEELAEEIALTSE